MRYIRWPRPLAAALAGVLLLGLMLGCTPRPPLERRDVGRSTGADKGPIATKTPVKIRFSQVVHSVFYTPLYAAVSQGFFKDEGLDVEIKTAWGSDRGAAAVLSGAADIALAGPEPAIYVHNQKSPTRLVIFAQLTAKDGSFFLARQGASGFKWSDVKGKTIVGGRPGGMPEMVLEYVLKQNGVTPQKDVKIITNLDFTAVPGAFANGTGHYVQLFEPTASEFESKGIGKVVASMGQAGGKLPYTVFMAADKYIKEHADAVQRFTNAVYRSMLWVEKNSPENVAAAVAYAFPETPREILVSVVKRYKAQNTWAPAPAVNAGDFERLQEVMISGGVLKPAEKVDYGAVITTDFARRAVERIK